MWRSNRAIKRLWNSLSLIFNCLIPPRKGYTLHINLPIQEDKWSTPSHEGKTQLPECGKACVASRTKSAKNATVCTTREFERILSRPYGEEYPHTFQYRPKIEEDEVHESFLVANLVWKSFRLQVAREASFRLIEQRQYQRTNFSWIIKI